MSTWIEIGGDAFTFSAAHAGIHGGQMEPLHGHTFAVTASLLGSRDRAGMIVDFHLVKRGLRAAIEPLRRRTLMPAEPVAGTCHIEDGQIIVECGDRWYSFPQDDVALLPIPNTTTEALAGYLLGRLLPYLKDSAGLERVELTLAEAADTRASVTADHGEGLW
ncbi:6-pyruvoyl tetrahydropterin synthase family protein [Nonomuraea sp. M3C6]|uniref:6-carboxy-5,6,7,8-tetrahydropterin synthase n=1 Tax=Nonomuraea marmarensis TaxID=3351344 RepID=A0ABW7AJ82_9ACTN